MGLLQGRAALPTVAPGSRKVNEGPALASRLIFSVFFLATLVSSISVFGRNCTVITIGHCPVKSCLLS